MYYNVHRWYEFGTGRYARPDPMLRDSRIFGLVALAPDGPSRGLQPLLTLQEAGAVGPAYLYTESNAANRTDPQGLASCDGVWDVTQWWPSNQIPDFTPRPLPRRPNRLPRHPSPQQLPGPGRGLTLPPFTCRCAWLCRPCDGEVIYDPANLPRTKGLLINTGRDAAAGDTCLCKAPGSQTGCDDRCYSQLPTDPLSGLFGGIE